MTADGGVFVDTNVLVYAHDIHAGVKHTVARDVLARLWDSQQGVLSTQVLQEFYVTVTRKLPRPLDRATARALLAVYAAWPVHSITIDAIRAATELEERHQLSFWDALIVSSAFSAGAIRLLSEDLQTGQTIEGILVENPFA
jgi:predicted nucleic acid-binding protein